MSSSVLRRGVACLQRPSRRCVQQQLITNRQAFTASALRSHHDDDRFLPPLLSSHHPPGPIPTDSPPIVIPTPNSNPTITPTRTPQSALSSAASSPQTAAPPPPVPKTEKPRPKLRATKAALTITPAAISRLRSLSSGPTPQLIRIGVRSKGCAGLSYQLDYADKPGPFDEIVQQDGIRVLIDSKALFSIIGSEMDWKEDALSAKFAFKNPNIKDACGCGESFSVDS